MQIRVTGEVQPQEADFPALFEAAKRNAQEQLSTASYAQTSDFRDVSKPEQKKAIQKLSAAALGTSVDDVDIESGAPLWERTKLGLLPDDQSRMEYLEKKYGSDGVSALDIGGTTKMFYRDPKSKKMIMVDEMGASLADFTADISGAAVTTAGAIAGGVAGTLLAPGAGTATGAILGSTAGAALGGFLTGVTQDVVAEAATGQDIELLEKVKKRGLESALGVPIDLATGGIGHFFSGRLAARGAKAIVSEVDNAITRVDSQLAKFDLEIPHAEKLRASVGGKNVAEAASARPKSKLARQRQNIRDRLGEYKGILTGELRSGATIDDFNRVSEGVSQLYKELVDNVSQIDKQLGRDLAEQASRKIKKLTAPKVTEEQVGERAGELIAPGVKQINDIDAANWANLKEIGADTRIPKRIVADAIEEAESHFERLRDPTSRAIAKELRQGMAGKKDLSFNEFKEIMDEISGSVSQSKVAGFTTGERVATRVLDNLRDLRTQIAKGNPQLGDALETTMDFYKNNLLATKRGAVGKILSETRAAPTSTNKQVATLLMQDPAYARQALAVARQAPEGVVLEAELRKDLQDLYLNRIGLVGEIDPKKMRLSYNDDMVRELWGDRQLRALQNLQQRLTQAQGVKVAELTREDVDSYLSALSANEKSDIVSKIVKRSKARDRLRAQKNAVLLKKMRPKYDRETKSWLEPDISGMDLASFSDGFIGAKPSQVKQAMKLMEQQGDELGIQAFRQGYIMNLFNRFSAGAQLDRFGNPLWNPKALAQAMQPGSTLRQNLDSVLGVEGAKDILAANRVLLEAAEVSAKQVQEIFQPRYSLTSSGIQLYGVGSVIGGLRSRALAWAWGSKRGAQMMQFLANKGSDEEATRILKKMLPYLMTSTAGIKAAAIQGEFDPEFTESIAPLFEGVNATQE